MARKEQRKGPGQGPDRINPERPEPRDAGGAGAVIAAAVTGGPPSARPPDPVTPAPPAWLTHPGLRLGRDAVAWTIVGGALLLFAILKSYGLNPDIGDEAIYFYDAFATASGKIPYRDYPLAHPPLQILVLAALYLITGPSILVGKLLPNLLALLSALLVLRIARRHLTPALLRVMRPAAPAPLPADPSSPEPLARWVGWAAGLTGLLLYLFAYDLLRCSTHYTGANLATCLALASCERILARRPLQAATLAMLAGMTGFYAPPLAVVTGAILFAPDRRAWVRFVGGTAGLFVAANLLCVLVAGWTYVEQVYLFHLAKVPFQGGNQPLWDGLVRDNLPLVLAGGLGGLLTLALLVVGWLTSAGKAPAAPPRRKPATPDPITGRPTPAAPDGRLVLLALLGGLAIQVATVLALKRVYTYYFVPLYPLLALLGGLAAGWVTFRLLAPPPHRRPVPALALVVTFLAGLLLLPFVKDPISPQDRGQTKRYRFFTQSPLPALDPFVRALFWQDERELDRRHGPILRYLWHESRYSEAVLTLTEQVRRTIRPGEELWGDSMTAPLVALLTGHRLAGDMADTNRQHYLSRVRDAAADIKKVDHPKLRFVICRGRAAVCGERAVQHWLQQQFRLLGRFPDPTAGGALLLFERK